jgi:hypothetical protein
MFSDDTRLAGQRGFGKADRSSRLRRVKTRVPPETVSAHAARKAVKFAIARLNELFI